MIRLTRTVRFAVNPPSLDSPGRNGCAGNPPVRGLGPFYEVEVICEGEADLRTGYLINIKVVDEAVRSEVLPLLTRSCWPESGSERDTVPSEPSLLVGEMLALMGKKLPVRVAGLVWKLSPYDAIEMHIERPQHTVIRRRFDFAASHRLHVEGWTDEQNRAAFGKCAHVNGHGHNYEIEPAIELPIQHAYAASGDLIESIVQEVILDRYDHKHLNIDTPEFGPQGLNPSVENIAKVCFDRLEQALASRLAEAKLLSLTAWETPRTSATYPSSR